MSSTPCNGSPRDVRIIAGSFGTDLVWPSFEKAIYRMYQSGKLMVFSVGNRCAPNGAQGARAERCLLQRHPV